MKELIRSVRKFNGQSVGFDLHDEQTWYRVFDASGNATLQGVIKTRTEDFISLLNKLKKAGEVRVAFEACGNSYWVYDLMLKELGRENVSVANPGKLHVIAKSAGKSDKNDAYWLGWLLHQGDLQTAYVPEGVRRELRIVCRELRWITTQRTEALVRIKSHLAQAGKKHLAPRNWQRTARGHARLKEIAEEVCVERGDVVQMLLKNVEYLDGMVGRCLNRIKVLSAQLPAVGALMEGLPGVGPITATALVAELNDAQKYPNAKAYAQATGLPPDNRKTAGKIVSTRMSRAGSTLARWALTNAAKASLRCTEGAGLRVRVWMREMMKHKKKKVVIVAAARKLAEGAWRLLNHGDVFDLERAFPLKAEGEKALAVLKADIEAKQTARTAKKIAEKEAAKIKRSQETEAEKIERLSRRAVADKRRKSSSKKRAAKKSGTAKKKTAASVATSVDNFGAEAGGATSASVTQLTKAGGSAQKNSAMFRSRGP